MPDLDAFEAEVKGKIKQLSSKDAATRRKAAAWLGEAGDPTAITSLAQVYKNDA
jgi:HEAT repeat protein